MLRSFSQRERAEALAALDPATPFDMLIIGGGITGAGAARDAALRGYRVALVEQGDYASGTSSKSTKLVHGGLRYLEQFEFGLVFESLQERRTLLQLAPHLVRPQPMLFPVYEGGKFTLPMMTAGMWAYDTLSLFRNVKRHRMLLGAARVDRAMPGLAEEGLRGAAHFYDAQTHDARLTLANAMQAHDAHATLLPYCRVLAFTRDEAGTIVGARVRDELDGGEHALHARIIVNCTGPWADRLIQLADPAQPPRMIPSKGSHIVFPKARLPLNGAEAIYLEAPQDGRPVFLIPWEHVTVVGTTDSFYDGPLDAVGVSDEDVEYLLAVANHAFPGAALTRDDVQSSWAGLRPLLKDPGAKSEGATSREHDIWEAPEGLVTIAGGKLTTYRVMAKQVIDVAAATLEARHAIPQRPAAPTGEIPLPGAEYPLPMTNPTTLAPDIWAHLVRNYGVHATDVARRAADEPALAARMIPTLPYLWAELHHAIEYEQALTADAFLARRTWLIYEAPERGKEVLDGVIARMGEALGWDEPRRARERERYLGELDLVVGK